MLITITTSVPALSRPLLVPRNFGVTYSLSDTNNNPFQTNTDLKATAKQSQTLPKPHRAPKVDTSVTLPSSTSVPNVVPRSPSPVITLNYTVPSVPVNNSVKTFDVFDHQKTPQKFLEQIDAHMTFTIGKQPLDPVACLQWHKTRAYIQCSSSGISLSLFW